MEEFERIDYSNRPSHHDIFIYDGDFKYSRAVTNRFAGLFRGGGLEGISFPAQ